MLADGEVTFQEYEQAILSTITCISDAGITVGTPELKYQRKYYWYDWEIPGDKAGELFPKLDACTGAWQPIVDAWYLEIAPTEEEISAGRRALVTCLRDAGIDIPLEATEQDFARLRSSPSPKFLKCVEKVREEFGLVDGRPGGLRHAACVRNPTRSDKRPCRFRKDRGAAQR